MKNSFTFKIVKKDSRSRARVGVITTPHGVIETPCFTPVGTQATVKGLTPEDLKECGVQLLFGNTYHLHLRPGEDVVNEFGGLAKFMNWDGVTITDSGGFQVFSFGRKNRNGQTAETAEVANENFLVHSAKQKEPLKLKLNPASVHSENFISSPQSVGEKNRPYFSSFASGQSVSSKDDETPILVKITDDGVSFRSHIDGSLHEFTPEKSIEIQQKLGADIILAFDQCAPHPFTHQKTKEAMERTHAWAVRCLVAAKRKSEYQNSKLETILNAQNLNEQKVSDFDIRTSNFSRQALYGIVHGGIYQDLREESAKFISKLDFDGIAIGGVSVGESKKEMREAVDWVVPYLPEDKPRHLLGIGEIDDIFDIIERGIDTFDCVIPTRFGRYGTAFVESKESEAKGKFRINLNRSIYTHDHGSISKSCQCSTCQNYTRGYLSHLFRANELLAYRLVSYHNMYFVINLVKKIRESILNDKFQKLKKEWME